MLFVGMQFDLANYLSLLVALSFVWARASPHLHPVRPPPGLTSVNVLAPILFFMAYFAAQQGIIVAVVQRQSWYHPDQTEVGPLCIHPAVTFHLQLFRVVRLQFMTAAYLRKS